MSRGNNSVPNFMIQVSHVAPFMLQTLGNESVLHCHPAIIVENLLTNSCWQFWSGWRLYSWKRSWWGIYLWRKVCRWKLYFETWSSNVSINGKRWPEYQRKLNIWIVSFCVARKPNRCLNCPTVFSKTEFQTFSLVLYVRARNFSSLQSRLLGSMAATSSSEKYWKANLLSRTSREWAPIQDSPRRRSLSWILASSKSTHPCWHIAERN